MANKDENKYYKNGNAVYFANELGIDFSLIPRADAGLQALIDYVEANFTFSRVWLFREQSVSTDPTVNQTDLYAAACDEWLIDSLATTTRTFNGSTWDVRNPELYKKLLGGLTENVGGSADNVTGEALTFSPDATVGWQATFLKENADGTVATAITVYADATPLTVAVDYKVELVDGKTVIVLLTDQSWATVLTADYTVTPTTRVLYGQDVEQASQPFTIVKLVSCAKTDDEGNQSSDVRYLIKAKINASFDELFPWPDETPTPTALSIAVLEGKVVTSYAKLPNDSV